MEQGFPRLLGDVGGTNARWAWQPQAGAALEQVRNLPCSEFDAIEACIAQYLRLEGLPAPRRAAFGIATAITGDEVQMTNHPWRFSTAALQASLGVEHLLVLNDFEALAKQHKVLEVQYGDAKVTSASDLLRMILLHAGAGFGLRQTVALVAESGGPDVSHVTLHKKERLAAPYLRALVSRLTHDSAQASPERWAGYELVIVDGSSFSGPGADGTDARVHLQLTDL